MKKQSGFTLIELLLVLAIIGIISAIAIPALLSQRARARDKSSVDNMVGRVGDLVGQYDKYKEAGLASGAIKTSLGNYIKATGSADKDPWDSADSAFTTTLVDISAATQSAALAAIKGAAGAKGKVVFGIGVPGAGTPGWIGGVVLVDNAINGSTKVAKVTAIE